jgi:hypothetical protein
MDYIEMYEHKYIFYKIFGVLLEAHTVQFIITFDKHVEIHFNYRK